MYRGEIYNLSETHWFVRPIYRGFTCHSIYSVGLEIASQLEVNRHVKKMVKLLLDDDKALLENMVWNS